jgi:hypothetical protein
VQVHGIVCGVGVNWIGLTFVGAQSFGGLWLVGWVFGIYKKIFISKNLLTLG